MRTITRNPNPPECLAQQPAGQDWYAFMQTQCHGLVSDSLHQEHHRVCCYCELKLVNGESHIEHLAPRSVRPADIYNCANLAASCNGGTGEHCGHFKDNHQKNPNYKHDSAKFCLPHAPNTSAFFHYLQTGKAVASPGLSSKELEKADYMIGYLGLACPRLTGRRKAHYRELVRMLGTSPDPDLVAWAKDYYLNPDQDGNLRSFYSLSMTILVQ